MKRLILILIVTVLSLPLPAQNSFKLLVSGEGETLKEASDAAFAVALQQYRTLLPDSVTVDLSKAVTGRKTIRSGFSGGTATSTLLVTFSMDGISVRKALRLQRQNTAEAFESLLKELESLAPDIMDGSVEFTSGDDFTKSASAVISWRTNANTARFCSILDVTLNALTLTEEEEYAVASQGLMTYNTSYFLNTPEYDMAEGNATIKQNIRHYSRDLLAGFTYEDDFHKEFYFLAPLDIKRLKRIFLIAVNAYKVTDDKGRLYVTNLREDFMDFFFVDDFAKGITNIDLWDVPLEIKYGFEEKWGPASFALGGYAALFLLPGDDASVICQVRYDPSTYSYYSIEPPVK